MDNANQQYARLLRIIPNADDWEWVGGDHGSFLRRWKLMKGDDVQPAHEHYCLCGQSIIYNCYIRSKRLGRIEVIGSCCVKLFMPNPEDRKKKCAVCRVPHNNLKTDLCNDCATLCCPSAKILADRKCNSCGRTWEQCSRCGLFHQQFLCCVKVIIDGVEYYWGRIEPNREMFRLTIGDREFTLILAKYDIVGVIHNGNYYWTRYLRISQQTVAAITDEIINGLLSDYSADLCADCVGDQADPCILQTGVCRLCDSVWVDCERCRVKHKASDACKKIIWVGGESYRWLNTSTKYNKKHRTNRPPSYKLTINDLTCTVYTEDGHLTVMHINNGIYSVAGKDDILSFQSITESLIFGDYNVRYPFTACNKCTSYGAGDELTFACINCGSGLPRCVNCGEIHNIKSDSGYYMPVDHDHVYKHWKLDGKAITLGHNNDKFTIMSCAKSVKVLCIQKTYYYIGRTGITPDLLKTLTDHIISGNYRSIYTKIVCETCLSGSNYSGFNLAEGVCGGCGADYLTCQSCWHIHSSAVLCRYTAVCNNKEYQWHLDHFGGSERGTVRINNRLYSLIVSKHGSIGIKREKTYYWTKYKTITAEVLQKITEDIVSNKHTETYRSWSPS